MIRQWKTVAIVMAVTVLVLSVVAVAYGATAKTRGAAGNGACGALTNDPKAVEAMQELRTEHQTEMRAWSDQYGSDPSSAEAQAALQKLREEHRNDMRDLFGKLGIEVPDGAGAGGGMMRGAGGCGGACGGEGQRRRAPRWRRWLRHDGGLELLSLRSRRRPVAAARWRMR